MELRDNLDVRLQKGTDESFWWLFDCLLTAVWGALHTVITHQDAAMTNAIVACFPESKHVLGMWPLPGSLRRSLDRSWGANCT
ncbi:hypothetical protein CCR75_008507 [Bremia lactucae]|uniref:MULE transposase domain-containing protein n=1 Tax=Bremia lactucae TaxID=4779 RepID=A0A976FHJ9_BRELC|nr:hypothetical protein CCR75_008507 [Bremia lactucae]